MVTLISKAVRLSYYLHDLIIDILPAIQQPTQGENILTYYTDKLTKHKFLSLMLCVVHLAVKLFSFQITKAIT